MSCVDHTYMCNKINQKIINTHIHTQAIRQAHKAYQIILKIMKTNQTYINNFNTVQN